MTGMGVDGIGRGGGLPPADAVLPEQVPEAAGVEAGPSPVEPAAPLEASAALERLRRGEIDTSAYLDVRAAAAVAHLEGRLPPDQLAAVRSALREQLETDPVLVELVRRATAGAPSAMR
jgi:hypothetical protein